MARPPDPDRRAQLLSEAVDYALKHGLSDLTLRPLAEALGIMPNTLVHHFGSKERLLAEVLNGVRDRLREARTQMRENRGEGPVRGVWRWSADPRRAKFFRSFFEAYGLALRQPERYQLFLSRVVGDWLPDEDAERATLELAVERGLLLDLLTTGDRKRVEGALELFEDRSL